MFTQNLGHLNGEPHGSMAKPLTTHHHVTTALTQATLSFAATAFSYDRRHIHSIVNSSLQPCLSHGLPLLARQQFQVTSVYGSLTNHQPLPIKRTVSPLCPPQRRSNPAPQQPVLETSAVLPDTVGPTSTMQQTTRSGRQIKIPKKFEDYSLY